ncbi:aarA, partial [Symbiodinium microadriaticum]
EGRHEPQHHRLKPGGGILKGSSEAAVPPNRTMSAAAQMSVDPKMQQGVGRVQEYLASVKREDVKQLPTVLKILRLMLPNLEVATGALALIFEFVRDVAESRQIVSQLKGIKDIVKAMTSHSNSMELQTHGCGCLYALSCFRADNPEKDNNSVAIAHAGGIARILHAMDSFPMCQEIQQWGTGSLRHLAIEIGGNRREVMEGGEIQLTMRGINRRMITKSGGIELMVQSMLRFPDDLEIQENGCAALCNLMANRHDTKVRAARSGSIRAVIAALRNFPFEPELAQMACAVLRSLALGVPENKISIVAQGGIRQLCEAMARHRTDAEVNMQAVAALCNLTSQLAENKRAICEAGGLEMAVAALMAHPQSQELQQQGCGLLHNLACDPQLRPQVNAAGGLRVAAAAIEHPVRAVQSLALMLQRQLQARQEMPPQAQEARKPAKTTASLAKDASDGGVDELFAPRTHTVRVARSKALTRPQRKVMADVMASMQQNPREWLPRDGSTAGSSASGDDTSKASQASSASGGGRWTLREQQRAASYGIEDLEGVSDRSSEEGFAARKGYGGAFAFVIRRGLEKQGSREVGNPRATKAPSAPKALQQEATDPKPPLSHLNLDLESPTSATLKGQPAFLPLTEQNLRRASYDSRDTAASADRRGQVSFATDTKEADAEQALDTRSQASSDQSEGGWVDDLDDPRLDKRARKQRRQLTKSSGTSSGILEEVFGEVELEVQRPAKQPRIFEEPRKATEIFAMAFQGYEREKLIELLDSITGEGATVYDKLRKMGVDSGLSREGLLGNLMVLFVAGMDTTSQALSWAFYQLACLPELQEELAAQVKTLPDGHLMPDQLESVQRLSAMWLETLRFSWSCPLPTLNPSHLPAAACLPIITKIWLHYRYTMNTSPEMKRKLGEGLNIFRPATLDRPPRHRRASAFGQFGHSPRICLCRYLADNEGKILLMI